MAEPTIMEFRQGADEYRRQLVDEILPWWLNHAIDETSGGLFTCIGDDGQVVAHDKYVWSQARALWTFSAAFNRIRRRREYLAAANRLFKFLMAHGRSDEGDWHFCLSRTGKVKEGPRSIQTDAFAICALAEYARASGKSEAVDAAMASFERSLWKILHPGSYETHPYPLPKGTKVHRVSMQFSLAYCELGKLTGRQDVLSEGMRLCDDVLDNFRRPRLKALVEYLSLENELLRGPIGSYCGPGHGIETAWFQLENLRGMDAQPQRERALDVMRWSLQRGWDSRHGGLLLGVDLKGREPFLPHSRAKLWWPHCEALCGTLMAHEACGEPWCLEWYDKVHEWSYAHFPNKKHGEWTQRLDRTGKPMDAVVALPVKDPFHLPRAMIYAIETLDRLSGKVTQK